MTRVEAETELLRYLLCIEPVPAEAEQEGESRKRGEHGRAAVAEKTLCLVTSFAVLFRLLAGTCVL